MASGPITSLEIDGETVETVSDFIFWAPKSLQMVIAAMKLKDAYSLEGCHSLLLRLRRVLSRSPCCFLKVTHHFYAQDLLNSVISEGFMCGLGPTPILTGFFLLV